MKYIYLLFLGMTLFSCQQENKSEKGNNTIIDNTINKIEVIDFYGTHRCVTCKAIEASAKHTLDTYFVEEQKKGIIVFKTVNVDDESNYDMAEKFEATGTALFLNVIKEGKESQIDLTDFAFENGQDQDAFSSKFKVKIEEQLNGL